MLNICTVRQKDNKFLLKIQYRDVQFSEIEYYIKEFKKIINNEETFKSLSKIFDLIKKEMINNNKKSMYIEWNTFDTFIFNIFYATLDKYIFCNDVYKLEDFRKEIVEYSNYMYSIIYYKDIVSIDIHNSIFRTLEVLFCLMERYKTIIGRIKK